MTSDKKNLAFTIAFGDQKYQSMAEICKKSFELMNPNIEFKIFSDGDFTPYENINKKLIYPKDFKYPKLEIFTKLKDKNTNYMFIDADSIINNNLSKYFDTINEGELTIEYRLNKTGFWANINNLNFVETCKKAGLNNIKPYSINSGFLMWRGHQMCFDKALEYILNYNLDDKKGLNGDEYYLCAAIQKCNTKINQLNYEKFKICKLWNENFKFTKNDLIISNKSSKEFDIIHYGNHNYYDLDLFKMLQKYNIELKITPKFFIKSILKTIKFNLKKLFRYG